MRYKTNPACRIVEIPILGYVVCGKSITVVNRKAIDVFLNALRRCIQLDKQYKRFMEKALRLGHLVDCNVDGYASYNKIDYLIPLQISIEATNSCNARCPYCYVWRSVRKASKMIDVDVVADVFESIYADNCKVFAKSLQITGGEPLLHSRIEDLLVLGHKYFERIALLTNGILLKNHIDTIAKLRDKIIVQVFIDSTRKDIYKVAKGVDAKLLDDVLESIALLLSKGVKVQVAIPVSKINALYVKETVEELVKMLGKRIRIAISPTLPLREARSLEKVFRPWSPKDLELYSKVIDQFYLVTRKYQDIILAISREDLHKISSSMKNCGAGWEKIAILPNGDVKPCPIFPDPIKLGNVYKTDIREILNPVKNKVIALLYEIVKPSETFCNSCDLKAFCKNCLARGFQAAMERDFVCPWAQQRAIRELLRHIKIK